MLVMSFHQLFKWYENLLGFSCELQWKRESLQWGFTSILVLIQHKAEELVPGMELEEIGKMSR